MKKATIISACIFVLLFLLQQDIFAQAAPKAPRLLPVRDVHLQAGCFIIRKSDDSIISELTADSVNFNVNGQQGVYQRILAAKLPKAYTEGFTNNIYTKYIDGKKDGCLTEMRYRVIIIYKKRSYIYSLAGFCGC